jgi:hypothetical protein
MLEKEAAVLVARSTKQDRKINMALPLPAILLRKAETFLVSSDPIAKGVKS